MTDKQWAEIQTKNGTTADSLGLIPYPGAPWCRISRKYIENLQAHANKTKKAIDLVQKELNKR